MVKCMAVRITDVLHAAPADDECLRTAIRLTEPRFSSTMAAVLADN